MADAAPAPAAVPTPAAPSNGAAPPKPVKPGPVVEVKPKPAAPATPPGEQMVEFPDHKGEMIRMTAKEAAAYIHRGKVAQETLTKWDRKRAEIERRESDFNARVERLKSDPDALEDFLTSNGVPRANVEKILAKALKEETLTEDQRALAEERRKREALEAKEKEREEQEQGQRFQAEVEQHRQNIAGLFMESLKVAEIPEEMAPELFPRMASLYRAVANAGQEPDPHMFAQHLRDKLDSLLAKRASSLPLEKLEGFIGKRKHRFSDDGPEEEMDYATYVRRRDLAALRAKRAGVPGAPAAPAAATRAVAGATITLDGEMVRNMPADLQNAYYAQLTAHPEEATSKKNLFLQLARKYKVKV